MERIFLGKVKKEFKDGMISGENLYLDKHSWDCGWYWGFGYIGNKNLHTHFSVLLHECKLESVFEISKYSQDSWYVIQELFIQAYGLKNAAGIYRYGGRITEKYSKVITDKGMETRIIKDLEKVLDTLWDFLEKNQI